MSHMRHYSPRTLTCSFAPHFGTTPAPLTPAPVLTYQLFLIQAKQASWATVIQSVWALRFFYYITLERSWMLQSLPMLKSPKTLSTILSQAEVTALLMAPSNLKHRTRLATLYAAGLRVAALCQLRIMDVDCTRMLLHIRLRSPSRPLLATQHDVGVLGCPFPPVLRCLCLAHRELGWPTP